MCLKEHVCVYHKTEYHGCVKLFYQYICVYYHFTFTNYSVAGRPCDY